LSGVQFMLRLDSIRVLIQAFPARSSQLLRYRLERVCFSSPVVDTITCGQFHHYSNHSSQGAFVQILAPLIFGVVHPFLTGSGAAPMGLTFGPDVRFGRIEVVTDRVGRVTSAHTRHKVMPGFRSRRGEFGWQVSRADEIRVQNGTSSVSWVRTNAWLKSRSAPFGSLNRKMVRPPSGP
jgi:hypothetical protein